MSEQDRAPGWYDDPSGPSGGQRWWNGISWGDQTRWAGPGPHAGPYSGPYRPSPVPRRRSPVPWILSGCLVVVLLFVAAAGGFIYVVVRATSGPRDVVNAYFAEIEQGYYAAAAGRLCDRYAGRGEAGVRQAFPEPVDGHVRSVTRDGDTADLVVDVTVGATSTSTVSITAVKEGGSWKVCTLPDAVPQ